MDVLLFSGSAAACAYHLRRLKRPPPRRVLLGERRVSFRAFPDQITRDPPALDRTRFPSLPAPTGAPLLGLLFAAAWCDDCWGAVPALDGVLRRQDGGERLIDVVYVSSDASEQQMANFKPDSMLALPYAAEEERSDLKRTYGVCAKKEMEGLGMKERKHGTPTLLLIDSETGKVLRENAVDCFMKKNVTPEQVLSGWRTLLSSKK
jgi:nucleoredoxin